MEPDVGRLGLLVRTVTSRRRSVDVGGRTVVLQGNLVLVADADGTDADRAGAELAPRERAVLELLVDRPGAVVSRASLVRRVWGADADPHALDATIARLRRRLGPLGLRVVVVRVRGYRLV